MSQSPSAHKQTSEQSGKVTKPAVLLGMTFLSTTWRMFLPIGGGIIIGLLIDRTLQTKVLWTLILFVVGAATAGYLVYRQLKRVNL